VTLLNISKWLNAVTIQTSDAAAIATINSLAFVKSTAGIAARVGNSQPGTIENSKTESSFLPIGANARIGNIASDYYNMEQIHSMKFIFIMESFYNIGLRGKHANRHAG
jgi:hypothetical protein